MTTFGRDAEEAEMGYVRWDRSVAATDGRRNPRVRWFVAPESRDDDEETELAFHRVWLARALRDLPAPRSRPVHLPTNAGADVDEAIRRLRARCGLAA